MVRQTGLWIDHEQAVIIDMAGKNELAMVVESHVQKRFRSPAGEKNGSPNGRRNVTADDIQERAATEHLHGYYDKIISLLHTADAIYIFGPGEAKQELVRRIQKSNLCQRVPRMETAGRMTARQIVAKVREHFLPRQVRADQVTVTGHRMPNFHHAGTA